VKRERERRERRDREREIERKRRYLHARDLHRKIRLNRIQRRHIVLLLMNQLVYIRDVFSNGWKPALGYGYSDG